MGCTRTHTHTSILQPCAETATPTRTPCQNLFLFTSCLHVLWWLWNLFLFLFFFLPCFFSLHLTQMWVFLPFHNAFCSPFLLTCVRLGSLDIFQFFFFCVCKEIKMLFRWTWFYILYFLPLIFLELQIQKKNQSYFTLRCTANWMHACI